MREIRPSGSEGGGVVKGPLSLPLSWARWVVGDAAWKDDGTSDGGNTARKGGATGAFLFLSCQFRAHAHDSRTTDRPEGRCQCVWEYTRTEGCKSLPGRRSQARNRR